MASTAAMAGAALFIVAGLGWAARLVHIGNLDALSLAYKTTVPNPVCPVDWPELRIRAIVPQPDEASVVLLLVEWPARQRTATMLVELGVGADRSQQLLMDWSATAAAIAPIWLDGPRIELRRRQSLARVRGTLIAAEPMTEPAPPRQGSGAPPADVC